MRTLIKGLAGAVCGGVVAASMAAALGPLGVVAGGFVGSAIVWMVLDS